MSLLILIIVVKLLTLEDINMMNKLHKMNLYLIIRRKREMKFFQGKGEEKTSKKCVLPTILWS
jgi:hypothetical protein